MSGPMARTKPFYKDADLELTVLHKDHMITGFKIVAKGKSIEFPVKGKSETAITNAWQKMEKHFTKLKLKI